MKQILLILNLTIFISFFANAQCVTIADPNADFTHAVNLDENTSTVVDVRNYFNEARRWEEAKFTLITGTYGNISLPDNLLSLPSDQQTFIITNAERVSRRLLPLQAISPRLEAVSQRWSDTLIQLNKFAHVIGASTPFTRMEAVFPNCNELEGENIYGRSPASKFVVEYAMSGFIYSDAGSNWGHRHGVFTCFNNDYGPTDSEGFMGIGISSTTNTNNFPMQDLVIDFLDPNPTAGNTCNYLASLPIELLSFQAKRVQNSVQLNWITSSEINNAYFEVEHAAEDATFNVLIEIKGSGTTSEQRDYQYTDVSPFSNVNYYRLKQTDVDGNFTYSSVVSISFDAQNGLSVYPSVSSDFIHVAINSSDTNNDAVVLQIFDITGRLIKSISTQKNVDFQLSLDGWVSGVYIVKLELKNFSQVVRFVKS